VARGRAGPDLGGGRPGAQLSRCSGVASNLHCGWGREKSGQLYSVIL